MTQQVTINLNYPGEDSQAIKIELVGVEQSWYDVLCLALSRGLIEKLDIRYFGDADVVDSLGIGVAQINQLADRRGWMLMYNLNGVPGTTSVHKTPVNPGDVTSWYLADGYR